MASNSIKIIIKNGAVQIASQVVARPATSATFDPLPVGALTADASAYPSVNGTGNAQAAGTVPLNIVADQQTVVSLTMATTIKRLDVTPSPITVTRGRTRFLSVGAYDAVTAGNLVLISPSTLEWRSDDSPIANVDQSGTVTGGLVGSTTIRVRETESGVTGTASVTTKSPAIYISDSVNGRIVCVDDMTGSGQRNTTGGLLSFPYGVVVDGQNRIYVADFGHNRIVRMDNMDGANTVTFPVTQPSGIAVDSLGRIYVTEFAAGILIRIDDMTGAGLVSYGAPTNPFAGPNAVALDSKGRIYVSEYSAGGVVRIDDMSGANRLFEPCGNPQEVTDVKIDRLDRVHAVVSGQGRIKWTNDFTSGFNSSYTGGTTGPNGVAFDSQNRIYICDRITSKIVRIDDPSGVNRVEFGSVGGGDGQFRSPSYIFVQE